MKYALLLYSFLIISLLSCNKNAADNSSDAGVAIYTIPPVVFHTSLHDSIPTMTYEALNVGKVLGIKIKNTGGYDARYFTYEADSKAVLKALAESPFDRSCFIADTLCRKITNEELLLIKKSLTATELEAANFFWDTEADSFEVYESIKPPLKHQLLVSKISNRILHRVELI
jgi:hypothetical protein